jgi:hypothetical protein
MADTRINYGTTEYVGQTIADAVRLFQEARNRMQQASTISGAIETDAELAAVLGISEANTTAFRTIFNGALAAMEAWAAAMARIDKGM